MNNGVIEQYGTASELYYQPSSKFVADFLGGGSYLAAKRVSNSEYETTWAWLKPRLNKIFQYRRSALYC
ncbi:ferric iron ABC transporter, ATP-binding protein [Vibrio sp. JCM 18904]|nr:ferric iron ABC transporter, ATP-binding protein [Vibrio sp. JCM 18904]